MRNKLISLAFCILAIFCISSCENKQKDSEDIMERIKKFTPEFDSDRQVIYYKEQMEYDIKGDIAVPLNLKNPKHIDFACQLSFFNYGEDIRLFNGCGDDLFVIGIGTINSCYVLESKDNIIIDSKKHSEKYGDWALVNIFRGSNYVSNVFMTPLAMKAYKDGEDDSFIFIQFVADDKYMNVIFYSGPQEWLLVKYYPQVIIQDHVMCNINALKNGPGKFWYQMY